MCGATDSTAEETPQTAQLKRPQEAQGTVAGAPRRESTHAYKRATRTLHSATPMRRRAQKSEEL